eukprot:116115_1
MSLSDKNLQNMFVINDVMFGKFISYLKKNKDVVICPIFMTTWIINEHTFDVIARSTDSKYQNMNVVVKGPVIKCDFATDSSIVFQPQLVKIENIFDVEMKLISTYNNSKIKVHFDVNCEYEDFYTSLHPRMMDTKWSNTFHITLPTKRFNENEHLNKSSNFNLCCVKTTEEHVDETKTEPMSISMFAMVHNVSDFTTNYKDLNSTNLMIKADMTAAA